MAKFKLNTTRQIMTQASPSEHVRIGSISVFALVVIICLAVLAVLSFSTANASWTLSQRQATATTELYLDETAAQEFVAGVDAILADSRTGNTQAPANTTLQFQRNEWGNTAYDDNGLIVVIEQEDDEAEGANAKDARSAAAANVAGALPDLCAAAQRATDNQVKATAEAFDNRIRAEFTCENGRLLTVVLTIRANGTYRIDRWKMSAVQNEEMPEGQYWIGD